MKLTPVHTLAEAEQFLFEELPKSPKTLFKHGSGIERSRKFFALLGNPQNELHAVHVAATSGKGSISHMLEVLLRGHGKTTGLHVSPHVYDYRERMMMNGELISERQLCDTLNALLPAIETMSYSPAGRPTYFETSNALAFTLFKATDYAIVEVGLGGLNDSTNTIDRPDKIAVIGQIGEDHVDILGRVDELEEAAENNLIPSELCKLETIIERIAVQKAGIMPFGGVAFALKQDPRINDVFTRMAAFRKTNLSWVERREDLPALPVPGDFQLDNLSLALSVLEYIAERDSWSIKPAVVKQSLLSVALPGRFEVRQLRGKTLVLDGSHNPQKVRALVRAFTQKFPHQKATVLMAMGQTKNADSSLQALSSIAERFICTDFFTNKQDFKSAPYKPQELAAIARRASSAPVAIARSQADALDQAYAEDTKLILITGSFYFLGEINEMLKEL